MSVENVEQANAIRGKRSFASNRARTDRKRRALERDNKSRREALERDNTWELHVCEASVGCTSSLDQRGYVARVGTCTDQCGITCGRLQYTTTSLE